MQPTRRTILPVLAGGPFLRAAAPVSPWTPEWDRALVEAAIAAQDRRWDPKEKMIASRLGGDYSYHSSIRNAVVHPTRDTLDYALLLLEAGGEERAARAFQAIERTISLQETDPAGRFYGIWGWYMEQPAPKMQPAADFNWADFNGSLLLLIENRHGSRLPAPLRSAVRESIRHAAYSVKRRNVTMNYTNIAVQGTFVVFAAAELLGDKELLAYAVDRIHRFARTVDETGSFAEYNSPTYCNVTIANLTRIRMVVKNEEGQRMAARLHERAWLHLGQHWHAPTRQLAGPMSRCYRTDIGQPLWIQKALGNRIQWAGLEDIRSRRASAPAEVAMLDYRCPESLAPLFLRLDKPRQHREIFLPASGEVRPVQGTTWLDRGRCLGSVNRGNFWIQQRPLVGYWGEQGRTEGFLQLRLLKDNYDFTSGLLYAVQEKQCILGVVNFRSPGGDKHPGLDPVRNGEFECSRLRLRMDVSGAPDNTEVKQADRAVMVDTGAIRIWIAFPAAEFAGRTCPISVAREDGVLAVSLDFVKTAAPATVRWKDVGQAFAAFALSIDCPCDSGTEDFLKDMRAAAFSRQGTKFEWHAPSGVLALEAGTTVATVAEQDRVFREYVNGTVVPLVRLSGDRLQS